MPNTQKNRKPEPDPEPESVDETSTAIAADPDKVASKTGEEVPSDGTTGA